MSKICPNCHNSVPDENLFCQTCGANLSLISTTKSTELALGEKMYIGLLVFSMGLEAILFTNGSGEFQNPAYALAPLLLGFFKQEPFVGYGNLSKPFKKALWGLILLFLVLFIWELRLGDPLRDAIILIFGPFIFLMILIMYLVVNFVFYTIGHVFYGIFRKN
ncbi:MAG: zinc ribbon domain-containing protein [Candidatus Heimdallarchaeota archaeon]|nr:zinc ribbon domain-containing protein [Candidatus Heimdallarchaeota archaeon]